MTSRERFAAAVTFGPADRAAFDLCGSPQTQIDSRDVIGKLNLMFGSAAEKRGDSKLDDSVLKHFNIDTRLVGGMPSPKTIHNRTENGVHYNNYGIGYAAVDDHFEICHNPLKGCTIDEMIAYPMPSADDIDRGEIIAWADRAKNLHRNTDYAIIAEHPVLGVFEIGCWMFGFDDYLYRLAAEPETVHAFSQRILSYQKRVIEIYYGALGRHIDCTTSGDDFGMQTGTLMSPKMFDELIKPYMKERINHTRLFTDAFYKHHTCGSVFPLIPSLIDCGVDILNPIQPGTYMMEPERLAEAYGGKIAFWGGVDTQGLLRLASPAEIKEEIGRLLSVFAGGGYVLSPAHCIQKDVPAENIAAIYEGAREYYATP